MKIQSNTNLKVLLFVGITGLWSSVEMHAMWEGAKGILSTTKRTILGSTPSDYSSDYSSDMLSSLNRLGPTETINNLTEVYTNIKADSAKDLSFTEVSALTQFWPRPKDPSEPLTNLFGNSIKIYQEFLKNNRLQMNSLFPTALESAQELIKIKKDFRDLIHDYDAERNLDFKKKWDNLGNNSQEKIKKNKQDILAIIKIPGFEQLQPLIDKLETAKENIIQALGDIEQKITFKENILQQVEQYKKLITDKKVKLQPAQQKIAEALLHDADQIMEKTPLVRNLSEPIRNKLTQKLDDLQEVVKPQEAWSIWGATTRIVRGSTLNDYSSDMLVILGKLGQSERINQAYLMYNAIKNKNALQIRPSIPQSRNDSIPFHQLIERTNNIYSNWINENNQLVVSLFPQALEFANELLKINKSLRNLAYNDKTKMSQDIDKLRKFIGESAQKRITENREKMQDIVGELGFEQSQPLINAFETAENDTNRILDDIKQKKQAMDTLKDLESIVKKRFLDLEDVEKKQAVKLQTELRKLTKSEDYFAANKKVFRSKALALLELVTTTKVRDAWAKKREAETDRKAAEVIKKQEAEVNRLELLVQEARPEKTREEMKIIERGLKGEEERERRRREDPKGKEKKSKVSLHEREKEAEHRPWLAEEESSRSELEQVLLKEKEKLAELKQEETLKNVIAQQKKEEAELAQQFSDTLKSARDIRLELKNQQANQAYLQHADEAIGILEDSGIAYEKNPLNLEDLKFFSSHLNSIKKLADIDNIINYINVNVPSLYDKKFPKDILKDKNDLENILKDQLYKFNARDAKILEFDSQKLFERVENLKKKYLIQLPSEGSGIISRWVVQPFQEEIVDPAIYKATTAAEDLAAKLQEKTEMIITEAEQKAKGVAKESQKRVEKLMETGQEKIEMMITKVEQKAKGVAKESQKRAEELMVIGQEKTEMMITKVEQKAKGVAKESQKRAEELMVIGQEKTEALLKKTEALLGKGAKREGEPEIEIPEIAEINKTGRAIQEQEAKIKGLEQEIRAKLEEDERGEAERESKGKEKEEKGVEHRLAQLAEEKQELDRLRQEEVRLVAMEERNEPVRKLSDTLKLATDLQSKLKAENADPTYLTYLQPAIDELIDAQPLAASLPTEELKKLTKFYPLFLDSIKYLAKIDSEIEEMHSRYIRVLDPADQDTHIPRYFKRKIKAENDLAKVQVTDLEAITAITQLHEDLKDLSNFTGGLMTKYKRRTTDPDELSFIEKKVKELGAAGGEALARAPGEAIERTGGLLKETAEVGVEGSQKLYTEFKEDASMTAQQLREKATPYVYGLGALMSAYFLLKAAHGYGWLQWPTSLPQWRLPFYFPTKK